MNRLSRSDIRRLLAQPLPKRIDQPVVETWAAVYWDMARSQLGDKKENTNVPFVMMFPPPNITGNLHLGHALTGAVQDALIRQRRMQGCECLFIPGFDHAGLATQTIIEKLLLKQKGISRQELGREKFVVVANDWKEKKLGEMRAQLNRLGLDLDYGREYFTMDDNSSFAVQAAFKQLFKSGLIYRANKQIFWSNNLQSTLSDIEVEQVDGNHRYVRTGEIVERKSLSQWFINAKEMAKAAVEVVNNASIEMIPSNYKRTWSSWLLGNGVHDWCISRQSWWGHRIPAYKIRSAPDVEDNWVVADNLVQAQSQFGNGLEVEQDQDVLDTWFSSSLLPLTISGWPDQEKFLANCQESKFPLHVLETGFDILTYWVSKMVMISLALTGRVPFNLILLHGMICDSEGKKMSKSLGNVIDPLDVVDGATINQLQARTNEAYSLGILDARQLQPVLEKQKKLFPKGIPLCGADGLRAYLLSHDIHEEIVRVQIAQIDKVRRLTNKIWNIFRLIFTSLDRRSEIGGAISLQMSVDGLNELNLDADDQQVLSEMSKCVEQAHVSFHQTYQLHHCFEHIETFMTEHLSHIYMEKIKTTIISDKAPEADRVRKLEVLATCLLTSTKIIHPFMPHLSEFLFQKLKQYRKSFPIELNNENEISLLSYEPFPKLDEWAQFSSKPLMSA